ncbi:MAG: hypothetical protein JW779_09755 [Candidatus Thorarchaeota archaeon]|nr:hypothetical protein [Candidatus Thorarchaeota archaeon]
MILILLFTSLLAAGGVLAIQWLRYNITYRVVYIQEIEEKLANLQDDYKVTPSSHLFGLEKGPLAYLLLILIIATETLFFSLAYTSYLFFMSLDIELLVSIFFTAIISAISILPFSLHVIQKEVNLRRREKESARDWKEKFRENLRIAIEELRSEGYDIKYAFSFSPFIKERESSFDIVVETEKYQFIFITKSSYWASKEKIDDARSFRNQIIFIATPHHEQFPVYHPHVFAISSASSSKDLRKYLLDGLTAKLFKSDNDIFEN